MDRELEIADGLQKITSCLEQLHRTGLKQHEFNTMVVKTLSQYEQELELLKVAVGELKKEVRACQA